MKVIDIVVYLIMLVAAVAWGMLFYGGVGLPRWLAIALALALGPSSVILGLFVFTRLSERKRN